MILSVQGATAFPSKHGTTTNIKLARDFKMTLFEQHLVSDGKEDANEMKENLLLNTYIIYNIFLLKPIDSNMDIAIASS